MTIEFFKLKDELIAMYTPVYGTEDILKRIELTEGCSIKNTFWAEKELIREIENNDGDSICFAVGKIANGYIELDREVFGVNHRFYFAENIKLTQNMFVAYRNISIIRKIDEIVNLDVYIGGDDENNEDGCRISFDGFLNLIKLFPNSMELTKYSHKRIAMLIKEFAPQCEEYEQKYETYVDKKEKTYIKKHNNTTIDINQKLKLEQFENATHNLKELLECDDVISESIWQQKISSIVQLLYPQYIISERELSFDGIDGDDKRPDFVLVDANGFVDVMEIKKPMISVLSRKPCYRNNYIPSREFAGSIQQIEKYLFCLNCLNREKDKFLMKLSAKLPNNMKAQVVNPQGILLLGRSNDFNEQQKRDFEIIKRQYKNVVDIMTYDDLMSRLERIIFSLRALKETNVIKSKM